MAIGQVNNPNEAGLFLNAIAYAAQEGVETRDEVDRMRSYFDEYYQKFGGSFIETLKDRIRVGSLSTGTISRIAPEFNWNAWGQPNFLIGQFDDPSEAGLLINAMAWVCDGSGLNGGEIGRIVEYFDEYYAKFGDAFINDLRERVYQGSLSRDTMCRVAPNFPW
jgi:hypothetical protein